MSIQTWALTNGVIGKAIWDSREREIEREKEVQRSSKTKKEETKGGARKKKIFNFFYATNTAIITINFCFFIFYK